MKVPRGAQGLAAWVRAFPLLSGPAVLALCSESGPSSESARAGTPGLCHGGARGAVGEPGAPFLMDVPETGMGHGIVSPGRGGGVERRCQMGRVWKVERAGLCEWACPLDQTETLDSNLMPALFRPINTFCNTTHCSSRLPEGPGPPVVSATDDTSHMESRRTTAMVPRRLTKESVAGAAGRPAPSGPQGQKGGRWECPGGAKPASLGAP